MPNGWGFSAPQRRKWRTEFEIGPGYNILWLANGKVRLLCCRIFHPHISISRMCPQPVVCLLRADDLRPCGEGASYIALKRADAKAMVRRLKSASIELVEADATKMKVRNRAASRSPPIPRRSRCRPPQARP